MLASRAQVMGASMGSVGLRIAARLLSPCTDSSGTACGDTHSNFGEHGSICGVVAGGHNPDRSPGNGSANPRSVATQPTSAIPH